MLSKLRLAIRNDLEAEAEQRTFGSGWLSGVLALVLGGSALLMLLAHHYPAWFSVEDLKRVHDSPFYMVGVQAMAFLAFGLACLNLTLRRNKILGFSAIALVLLTMTLAPLARRPSPAKA